MRESNIEIGVVVVLLLVFSPLWAAMGIVFGALWLIGWAAKSIEGIVDGIVDGIGSMPDDEQTQQTKDN